MLNRVVAQDAVMAATPTLFAATEPLTGGSYSGPSRRREMAGPPALTIPAANALRSDRRRTALDQSEALTGVALPSLTTPTPPQPQPKEPSHERNTATISPPNQTHSLTTMRAIVQHSYGTADVLKLDDIDRPSIGDNDVLIRVRAASVNHADWVYTTGTPLIARLAFGLRAPKEEVRGKDAAGTVEAVGAAVTRFAPGDDVYAELEAGSFAEFARATEDEVALMPANLSFEQAATVPLAGTTALRGSPRRRAAFSPGRAC